MSNKVYCMECRYLDADYSESYGARRRCSNANNTKSIDTWLCKKITKYVKSPKQINKNNDCEWYKAR